MTTPTDGLDQFNDWYDALPTQKVDSLLSLFDVTFDAIVAEHKAYSTFPPLVVDKGVGVSI
jgi:hypothetical protein